MAQNTAAEGRTDTKRFSDDVSGDDLIEGDRIDKRLVARHPSQLGSPLRRTMPDEADDPATQLVVVTQMDSMADVHSALLYDSDAELFIRASRHDSQQAWSQKEADWTVRDIGQTVTVETLHELKRPDNEHDEDEREYVQHWVEALFDDVRYNDGDTDFSDERELDGNTLKLRDVDGREALATISLEE